MGVLLSYAASSAMYYRPLPHPKNCEPVGTKLREFDESHPPIGLVLARFITCSVVTTAMKWIMTVRNTFEVVLLCSNSYLLTCDNATVRQIVNDTHSASLFDAMRRRTRNTALITVGNHVSSMDDPGLLGKLPVLIENRLPPPRKTEITDYGVQRLWHRGILLGIPGECDGRWQHRF